MSHEIQQICHLFQSHAGSIEAEKRKWVWTTAIPKEFQSHAGSIEALICRLHRRLLEKLFQSHAGSIEALADDQANEGLLGFQSHAGSIEAWKAGLWKWKRFIRFNPTLVRLRR